VDEGRQIEAGSATDRSEKVVRLPRDWLGPREDLVPFSQAAPPPLEPELDAFAPNDFWGERAAVIHSVVQAPEDDARQDPPAGESEKPRSGRRRLAAAAAVVGIAAAGALVILLGGSPNRATPGPRLNIAAILNSGISRILKGGPPHVVAHATPRRAVQPVRHHVSRPTPAPARAEHHSSTPSVSTYVARASTSTARTTPVRPAPPAPRIVTRTQRAQSTASASATVTPTGQNGALGPVQSPNG
jgi:hypothetical protein